MNIKRYYGDGLTFSDFLPQEVKMIGETLLGISALAYGDKGKCSTILRPNGMKDELYSYECAGMILTVVSGEETDEFRVELEHGGERVTVFNCVRFCYDGFNEIYYVYVLRLGAWMNKLNNLAKNEPEVREAKANFAPINDAEPGNLICRQSDR